VTQYEVSFYVGSRVVVEAESYEPDAALGGFIAFVDDAGQRAATVRAANVLCIRSLPEAE
jgi:hypothetical protein